MASSRITIGAFFRMALAMEILCFSPPERCLPASPAEVSHPFPNRLINSSHLAARAARNTSSSVAAGFPSRIFSFNEQLNKKLSCVTKLTIFESSARGISLISIPPIRMEPSLTSQKRSISLATVDFPPPDGPTKAVTLSWGISKLIL